MYQSGLAYRGRAYCIANGRVSPRKSVQARFPASPTTMKETVVAVSHFARVKDWATGEFWIRVKRNRLEAKELSGTSCGCRRAERLANRACGTFFSSLQVNLNL